MKRLLLVASVVAVAVLYGAVGSASAGTNWWCYPSAQATIGAGGTCTGGTYYTINAARQILYSDFGDHSQYGSGVYHCVSLSFASGGTAGQCNSASWVDVVLTYQTQATPSMSNNGSSVHWFRGRAAYGGDPL